jgi:hypothetical protein
MIDLHWIGSRERWSSRTLKCSDLRRTHLLWLCIHVSEYLGAQVSSIPVEPISFQNLLRRMFNAIGAVATAAVIAGGSCYIVGSIYLHSRLAGFGAGWAWNVISPSARLGAGLVPLATTLFLIAFVLAGALKKVPSAREGPAVVRAATGIFFLSLQVVLALALTRLLPPVGGLLIYGLLVSTLGTQITGLASSIFHSLASDDPFSSRPFTGPVLGLVTIVYFVHPWALGHATAEWDKRHELQNLPLAVLPQDNPPAEAISCRIIASSEEKAICLISRSEALTKVRVVDWSAVIEIAQAHGAKGGLMSPQHIHDP